MADLVQMLIEILRINCSTVNCYYQNQLEAIFNLFFFPTVFILVVIYLLLTYIFDELKGGLRFLVAVTLYAVIILNGFMTFFIPLSNFWWIVIILLFGGYIFVNKLIFKSDKNGGKGGLGAFTAGGLLGAGAGYLSAKASGDVKDRLKIMDNHLNALETAKNRIKQERKGAGGVVMTDDAGFSGLMSMIDRDIAEYIQFVHNGNRRLAEKDRELDKRRKRFHNIVHGAI